MSGLEQSTVDLLGPLEWDVPHPWTWRRFSRGCAACIYSFLLVVIAVLVMSVVCLIYPIIRPISERHWLRLACFLQASYVVLMGSVFEWSMDLCVTGDSFHLDQSLNLSNHQNHDWIAMWAFLAMINGAGTARCIVKQSLLLIPGVGWGLWAFSWILLSRNYSKDKQRILTILQSFQHCHLPIQIYLFPEGTRIKPKTLAASRAYARAEGYEPWRNVLIPRYRGFNLVMDALEGSTEVIYDWTIAYSGFGSGRMPPSLFQMLFTDPELPKPSLHIHLERIPFDFVPKGMEKRKAWLYERFAKKEQLLEAFYRDGEGFPGTKNRSLQSISILYALLILVVHLVSFIFLFIVLNLLARIVFY